MLTQHLPSLGRRMVAQDLARQWTSARCAAACRAARTAPSHRRELLTGKLLCFHRGAVHRSFTNPLRSPAEFRRAGDLPDQSSKRGAVAYSDRIGRPPPPNKRGTSSALWTIPPQRQQCWHEREQDNSLISISDFPRRAGSRQSIRLASSTSNRSGRIPHHLASHRS